MDSQLRHERIIKAINEAYHEEKFTLKKKQSSPYNSDNNRENFNEILSLGALIADVMHYTGGSVGNVDLYQLLEQYLTNDEKRNKINDILRNRY